MQKKIDKETQFIMDLYDQNLKLMYYIALDIVKDEYLAEDIVQDVFLKLISSSYLNKIMKMDKIACRSYLKKMIQNKAVTIYHKYSKEILTMSFLMVDDCSIENPLNKQVNRVHMAECISKIPELYRSILIGKYIYDYSDEKLSKMHGISVSLVRKRLERGRKKLRKMYELEND